MKLSFSFMFLIQTILIFPQLFHSISCILRPPLPHPPLGQAQTQTFTTINQDQGSGQNFQNFQQFQSPSSSPNPGETVPRPDLDLIQRPSQELSPPFRDPGPPPPLSSSSGSDPSFQSQSKNVITINGETLELLPPVEIPPAFPINPDQGQPQGQGQGSSFSSSLIPTTSVFGGGGPQSSFSSFDLPQNPNAVNPSPLMGGGFGGGVAVGAGDGRDPGLDCLGSCDCPADFNFVCGSNRFLYQNECALNCDKKCHPDVIKVSMSNCSR